MANGRLVHIATFLPVRRWRDVLPFLIMSSRVASQAKRTPGYVAHGLKADFPRRRFWTLSVWNDRGAVNAFVRSEPHSKAVKKFKDWAGEGAAFAEWSNDNSSIDWTEAMERLKTPNFYYKS